MSEDPAFAADPAALQEAQSRLERWRRRAGRVHAALVDAVLDDPAQRAVVTHAFAYAPELAEACIQHPEVVFDSVQGRWRDVIAQAEADLSALDMSWGPTESLSTALRPIRDRVFASVALTALAGLASDSDVHIALTQAAERMISAALNALVRRAVRHGDLSVALDPLPQPLPGLFVLGGGDLAAGETGYAGPLELAVIYDPVRLQEIGVSNTACERALVHIAAELREVFSAPARGTPLLSVSLETIGLSTHVRLALNADDVLYAIGLPPPQPRRAWFAGARAIAGDLTGAAAFLTRVQERLYTGRYGAVDLALAAEDFNKPPQRGLLSPAGGVPELTRLLLCLRLVAGAKDAAILTAPARAVIAFAREANILSADIAERLLNVIAIARAVRDTAHLVAGAAAPQAGQSGRIRAAQAALAGFRDAAAFTETIAAAEAEARNAWAALVSAAPLAARPDHVTLPSLVVTATPNRLEALGFDNTDAVSLMIDRWVPQRDTEGAPARIAQLVPGLITAFAETDDPNGAVARFDRFLAGCAHEREVFAALESDPDLVAEVANVFGNAPAVAEAVVASPQLMAAWPSWERALPGTVSAEDWMAANLGAGPTELSGRALRDWARDLKAQAACDVVGHRLEAAEVHAVFTAIAEAAVTRAYDLACARVGEGADVAIIAMGAFGAHVLSFDSPLELVFVSDQGGTEGSASELAVRSAEFTRDLVEELTAEDYGPPVFRIDMSSRPGAQNGQITAPLRAYLAYYGGPAAPAEHLALTRARILCAPADLRLKLETGLRDILTRGRRTDRLAADADRVRHKSARESEGASRWDLETMPGGLADIQLIAAALQLRFAAEHPYVLSPDPEAGFAALTRAGALDLDTAAELTETYRFYSRINAILAITGRIDLAQRRPRPRLAALIARAAGVSEFTFVEPLIRGHAERTIAHYKRLFLTPQPTLGERRFGSVRSVRAV